MVDDSATYKTLRELVRSFNDSTFYLERFSEIDFELNHLELHDLDDYLLTCYYREVGDPKNKNNSNIKYLLGLTEVIAEGAIVTKGGSFPDIDLDFEHEKRELVKGHLRDHYGHDHVASIGTFGISKARGIFKDVARAYGLDFAKSNLISKMFPDMCNSIADALEESEDLVKVISTDPEVSEVIEYAQRLEGTVRSVGVHAAGVIVTPVPATKLVPLFASKGEPVTMFDGESLERVGIIKFDLLGLKSLTAIGKAIDLIKHRLDIDIDIDNIPEDDFGAYDLIGSNNSLAIFQIEGSRGLMDFAAASKPANIVDLATVISLFRPGPMGLGATDDYINRRSGKEPSVFEIPEYDYIFKETLGLISFQEQFMQLAGDMCGFDDIKRDVLRKATAKKDVNLMKSLKKDFVDGAVSHGGQNRSVISKLFNRLEEFARYSFNKSHAVAYAYISYQTAWLKSNYTAEYMAASISCEPDTEQQSLYMADAKRNGVDILPPDVNASGKDFVVNSDGKILFGFNSIKGMGERAIERVISLQPYDSFGLFLILTYHAKGVNRKVIDALIYSGACDSFGYKRSGLVIAFESFLADYVSLVGTAKLDLIVAKKFCLEEARYFDVEGTEELPMLTILDYEKDLLGLHVSGNPFDIISQIVREELTPLADYERIKNGTVYSLCLVDTFKKIVTKKGKRMGFLDLSDREGDSASVVVFPNTFEEVGDSITAGIYLVVGVLIKTDDRGKNFILNSAQDLTAAIRKVSEQVEESKSVKNIDLVMGDCSTVRMRSLRKKIDHYVTSEDLGYKATVVVPLNGFDFKIKEFNIQPINISMLREFSRLSGLIVRRR